MTINENNIQQIVEINRLIHNCRAEIKTYQRIATQLATANCSFEISINFHNNDLHNSNTAKLAAIAPDAVMGAMLTGQPFAELNNMKLPACRHRILDSVTESTGLRIVNALIMEREAYEKKLREQLIQITELAMHENPIQSLHQKETV